MNFESLVECTRCGAYVPTFDVEQRVHTCRFHPGRQVRGVVKSWSCCDRELASATLYPMSNGCQTGPHVPDSDTARALDSHFPEQVAYPSLDRLRFSTTTTTTTAAAIATTTTNLQHHDHRHLQQQHDLKDRDNNNNNLGGLVKTFASDVTVEGLCLAFAVEAAALRRANGLPDSAAVIPRGTPVSIPAPRETGSGARCDFGGAGGAAGTQSRLRLAFKRAVGGQLDNNDEIDAYLAMHDGDVARAAEAFRDDREWEASRGSFSADGTEMVNVSFGIK